ncbi:MAG TPA: hypothetical protein P5275_02720 [Saprospiraceae bacterium]|nr:hypothetical protein [Saprospiraceae bacterium]MCB9271434.1 hypothetical protein [Lewinellaceae bacterium]HPG08833.1 hypothetical protein [Saprospiraceae bacterium]HPQ98250.1 hypothetical protein [Saprospiraceae bacterium]HRV83741.1 hypothetical protein [Saprospiraceae bacterium]
MDVLRTKFQKETLTIRKGQTTAILYFIITSILGFLLLGTKQELLIWLCATFFYISGGLTVTFSNARWGFGFLIVTLILIESLFYFYPFHNFWLWSLPTKVLYLYFMFSAFKAARRREVVEATMIEYGWHPLGMV